MADHSELVSELSLIEKMSTQERLKHARKRRLHQLKKWSQREKEYQQMKRKKISAAEAAQGGPKQKNKSYKVHFVPSVMLLEAAARNDVEEVRRLLMLGVSPDSTNEDGLTALHQCCIDDSEEMMKLLLEFGANVNAKDSEQWTPLHAAATCGHIHLVRYLISKDADLLAVNADGNMPYDICEDEGTLDFIESEMAKKGITQEMIDETRAIPEKQMLSDLKCLLEEGEDIDYRDHQGATPLHIAAANGYLSVVEFLLDNNVPTDVCDNDMWQPIHAAACWGHPDVIEMLVMAGADLSAKTKNGETPFDICEDHELRERILQLKNEMEIKRASQPQKLRRSHSQNTRSQSVRRTSIRDKSLMSRREAREEARIWHEKQDQNNTDEDEEVKVQYDSRVSEKELLNGEHAILEKLSTVPPPPASGNDKVARENPNLVEIYQQHSNGVSHPFNEKNCVPPEDEQESNDALMENVSLKDADDVSAHPGGELCDASQTSAPVSPRNQEAVKVEIHVTVNTSPTYTPNHGTLADLKKHRSDMRSRSSLTLNSSQQDISGKMITHNGHTFSATYLYDQPPSPTISLRRFCSDPSEIVGEPHNKGCCAIM